jgi:hypothetical protein
MECEIMRSCVNSLVYSVDGFIYVVRQGKATAVHAGVVIFKFVRLSEGLDASLVHVNWIRLTFPAQREGCLATVRLGGYKVDCRSVFAEGGLNID